MAKKPRDRFLLSLKPGVKEAINALAEQAGIPATKLIGTWIEDALPTLHAVTMAAKAARAGRAESAIQILDGIAAQHSEQLDFIGKSMNAKARKQGRKKKAR